MKLDLLLESYEVILGDDRESCNNYRYVEHISGGGHSRDRIVRFIETRSRKILAG